MASIISAIFHVLAAVVVGVVVVLTHVEVDARMAGNEFSLLLLEDCISRQFLNMELLLPPPLAYRQL